ncbi:MAG TPA: DUF488 family protein [Pseudomonadales bacterium]
MTVRIVRLGSARSSHEGIRIGTVRRPPRGVPKADFASQNWYDVWFPVLAPSAETLRVGQAAGSATEWLAFVRQYRSEMKVAEAEHALNLLAALSHTSNFSVGCYCATEERCHRSILRELLLARGARFT